MKKTFSIWTALLTSLVFLASGCNGKTEVAPVTPTTSGSATTSAAGQGVPETPAEVKEAALESRETRSLTPPPLRPDPGSGGN